MQLNSERMKQMERLFPKVQVTGNVEIEEIKMKDQDQNLVNPIKETLVDQNDQTNVLPTDWSEEDQKAFEEIIDPDTPEGKLNNNVKIKNSTISGIGGVVAGTAANLLLGRSLLPTTVGVVFGVAGCYGANQFVDETGTGLKSNIGMFAAGFSGALSGAAVVNMFTNSVEEADKLIEENKEFFEEISEPVSVVSETTETLEMVF